MSDGGMDIRRGMLEVAGRMVASIGTASVCFSLGARSVLMPGEQWPSGVEATNWAFILLSPIVFIGVLSSLMPAGLKLSAVVSSIMMAVIWFLASIILLLITGLAVEYPNPLIVDSLFGASLVALWIYAYGRAFAEMVEPLNAEI